MAGVAQATLGEARAAEPIRVVTAASHYYMPSFFAAEHGIFARHGLDVAPSLATAPPAILPAVVAGAVQIGASAIIQLITSHETGLDIVAVAAGGVQLESHPSTAILVSDKSGIREPADFRGKRVAAPGLNGSFHIIFLTWLANHGVDPKSITMIEIGYGQMADALRNGSVDAALAVEPFMTNMERSGAGRRIEYFVLPGHPVILDSVLIASRAWTSSHQAEVAAFRAGLREAVQMMAADPQAAAATEGRVLKLAPEVVARMGAPDFRVDVTPEDLAVWIEVCRERGLITQAPDPRGLIA